MITSPLISIVIPVYNVEALLERCVNSVLSQTYDNIQVILVDDGSTDSSGHLCDVLAAEDNRIEVIHTLNGGLSAARNVGMKSVKGEWVAFVDSDDMIGEKHVENLLRAAISLHNKIVVAVTGSSKIGVLDMRVKNVIGGQAEHKELSAPEAIEISVTEGERFASHAWGKLYPKELFSLLEYPVGKYFEDQFVTYKVFLKAEGIVYENANDYGYTIDRNTSISNSSYLHRLDYLEAIRDMRNDLKCVLPEVNKAMNLRFFATLASSAAIATLPSGRQAFAQIYSEIVETRRDALRIKGLPIKVRIVYLLSYFGLGITRLLLTIASNRICTR